MTNDSDDLTLTDVSAPTSFSSIGLYRLVRMLGVGGMGEVWRAEQTAPFHRTVKRLFKRRTSYWAHWRFPGQWHPFVRHDGQTGSYRRIWFAM